MIQTDPQVSLPPATISIYVDWDTGSGPVASHTLRDIGTRSQNVYDALTGEPDPTLFGVEPYSGGGTLINGYDQQVKLLTRGLYLVTTYISTSSGGADDATEGNSLAHIVQAPIEVRGPRNPVWFNGEQSFHADSSAMISEQFLVGEGPASLFLRFLNWTDLSQNVGAVSSIISRISPL